MNKFLIIPNANKDEKYATSIKVAEILHKNGGRIYIEEKYDSDLDGFAHVVDGVPNDVELIIVVGGDGSVIDASVFAVERNLPVLGVNLGKLGYLAEVEVDELQILNRLFTDEFKIDDKMLLSVTVGDAPEGKESSRYAVNDVIISHESYVGLAELSLKDSNGASLKYRADGLILATPVGSTAYSFSAGGPVVSHDIDSIIATPICPHSLFNRSVIFKPSEKIRLKNNGKQSLNVGVDGRYFTTLRPGECCYVSAAERSFRMLSFKENNMFSTLFEKMKKIENI